MLLQRIDKDKKNPIQLSIMGTKTSKHTPKVASVNKNLVLHFIVAKFQSIVLSEFWRHVNPIIRHPEILADMKF